MKHCIPSVVCAACGLMSLNSARADIPVFGSSAKGFQFEVIAMLTDGAVPKPEVDTLPGMAGNAWQPRSFDRASIGDDGSVVFQGKTPQSFQEGVWTGTPGNLRLMARSGAATPEGGSRTYKAVREPALHGNRVSFTGSSESVPSPAVGEIRGGPSGGTPALIARAGDTVPGGAHLTDIEPPTILANGNAVFYGRTDLPAGAGADFGIFLKSMAGIQSVARMGQPAPGHNAGETIVGLQSLVAERDTGLAYVGVVRKTTGVDKKSIYRDPTPATPAPELVVAIDHPAPGTGGDFWFLGTHALGGDGTVFFQAKDFGAGPSFFSGNGIWKYAGGQLTRILRGGENAPGTGLTFGSLFPTLGLAGRVCDDHGRIAMLVNAEGERLGIWLGDEHGVRFVALKGEIAPGIGATWNALRPPTVGPSGHVAFQATTDLPNGDRSVGIWVADVDGTVLKLVEKGDRLMLRGKLRTVDEVQFNTGNGTPSFRQSPINALGQVVFSVGTDDDFQFLLRASIPFPSAATRVESDWNGEALSLHICSRLGYDYQLEGSEHLDEWERIGEPVPGDGGTLTFACPVSEDDTTRSFRIRITAGT